MLLGDLTGKREVGQLHMALLSSCATGPFGWGGGERKSANGTFPDSYPSWIREKGGFRLGHFPTGKVVLSCVAWPPEVRASVCGSINVGFSRHASLSWHRAVDSSTEGSEAVICPAP